MPGECFIVLLTAIIDEFGIDKADAKKKNKLKLAKLYPFADDPEERARMEQELLGDVIAPDNWAVGKKKGLNGIPDSVSKSAGRA